MCRSETKAIGKWPPRRRRHQSNATPKRAYLVTDDGFGRRLAANLLAISLLAAACVAHLPARDLVLNAYHETKELMMRIAGEMAWWSLLGLLSSSCCAIQVLLGALSLGCAGFNPVLGPMRPSFVALTVAAQVGSWYAARFSRAPNRWRTTAASTLVSSALTLLPEALAWRTKERERSKSMVQNIGDDDESVSSRGEGRAGGTIQLRFRLSSMGCVSCASTVSKVLDGFGGVLRHSVTLEDGMAEIVLDEEFVRRHERTGVSELSMHGVLWKDVADRLEAAGFPVDNFFDLKKER